MGLTKKSRAGCGRKNKQTQVKTTVTKTGKTDAATAGRSNNNAVARRGVTAGERSRDRDTNQPNGRRDKGLEVEAARRLAEKMVIEGAETLKLEKPPSLRRTRRRRQRTDARVQKWY